MTGKPNAAERESITAYLRRLAHDLRSPLSALLSYSALLRDGALGPVNDAQRAALDDMVLSARELAAVVATIGPGPSGERPTGGAHRPTGHPPDGGEFRPHGT